MIRDNNNRWKNASSSNPPGCPGCCWPPNSRSSACSSSGPRARQSSNRFSCRTPSACPREWVGLDNFKSLFAERAYLDSFKTTAFFSVLVAVLGISLSLVLAVFADRVVRGAMFYKTFLIVPVRGGAGRRRRAVALHVLAHAGHRGVWALAAGVRLELPVELEPRDDADRDGRRVESDLLQLPVLPGGAPIHPEKPDRGRGHRRRRAVAAFLEHPVAAAVAHHVLPAGHQRRLRVFQHLRHRRRNDPGRARARTP